MKSQAEFGGHLFNVHGLNVDLLSRSIRCVEKEGLLDGEKPVTFLRFFNLPEVEKKGRKSKVGRPSASFLSWFFLKDIKPGPMKHSLNQKNNN